MSDDMREARRRRILENSEKRLQRILGLNTDLTETGVQPPELLTTSSLTSGVNRRVESDRHIVSEPLLEEEPHIIRSSNVDESGVVTKNPIMGTVSTGMNKRLFEFDGGLLENGTVSKEQTKNAAGLLVLLAITSITLLYTSFGVFIGHNVLIPFGVFEAYMLLTEREQNQNQSNNVFKTVLMLSGLPQHKLSQITKILHTIQMLLQDLCVYLFACFISYRMYTIIN